LTIGQIYLLLDDLSKASETMMYACLLQKPLVGIQAVLGEMRLGIVLRLQGESLPCTAAIRFIDSDAHVSRSDLH